MATFTQAAATSAAHGADISVGGVEHLSNELVLAVDEFNQRVLTFWTLPFGMLWSIGGFKYY